MSWAGITACLWVLGAAIVALLPMRRQYAPGLVLLGLVPVLIVSLSMTYGIWAGLGIFAVFLSMFRRPLIYLAKRAMGQHPKRPEEDERA